MIVPPQCIALFPIADEIELKHPHAEGNKNEPFLYISATVTKIRCTLSPCLRKCDPTFWCNWIVFIFFHCSLQHYQRVQQVYLNSRFSLSRVSMNTGCQSDTWAGFLRVCLYCLPSPWFWDTTIKARTSHCHRRDRYKNFLEKKFNKNGRVVEAWTWYDGTTNYNFLFSPFAYMDLRNKVVGSWWASMAAGGPQ